MPTNPSPPVATCPPAAMCTVPGPVAPFELELLPRFRFCSCVHFEPAPVTFTLPLALGCAATIDIRSTTWPPPEIVSEPLPSVPTTSSARLVHTEPVPLTVTLPTDPFSAAM